MPEILNEKQIKDCADSKWDFSDLKALFLNCTLKKSPELSHTDGLIRISKAIMEKNKVSVETLRPVDHEIANDKNLAAGFLEMAVSVSFALVLAALF